MRCEGSAFHNCVAPKEKELKRNLFLQLGRTSVVTHGSVEPVCFKYKERRAVFATYVQRDHSNSLMFCESHVYLSLH